MAIKGKEAFQIAALKRVGFQDRAAVLTEEVDRAQDGAVINLAVQIGDRREKFSVQ